MMMQVLNAHVLFGFAIVTSNYVCSYNHLVRLDVAALKFQCQTFTGEWCYALNISKEFYFRPFIMIISLANTLLRTIHLCGHNGKRRLCCNSPKAFNIIPYLQRNRIFPRNPATKYDSSFTLNAKH